MEAPTNPITDDANNSFGWTPVVGYDDYTNYEYCVDGALDGDGNPTDGGTYTACTANPQPIPEENYAVGTVSRITSYNVCYTKLLRKKVKECISCSSCAIMNGFGGAGAFSDGKYNFTTQFGGWLNDYLPDEEIMELIEYVDKINVKFGATLERFSTFSKEAKALEKRALQHDLHLLQAAVKHFVITSYSIHYTKLYEFIISSQQLVKVCL